MVEPDRLAQVDKDGGAEDAEHQEPAPLADIGHEARDRAEPDRHQ
jgi:hypothetical protein